MPHCVRHEFTGGKPDIYGGFISDEVAQPYIKGLASEHAGGRDDGKLSLEDIYHADDLGIRKPPDRSST